MTQIAEHLFLLPDQLEREREREAADESSLATLAADGTENSKVFFLFYFILIFIWTAQKTQKVFFHSYFHLDSTENSKVSALSSRSKEGKKTALKQLPYMY